MVFVDRSRGSERSPADDPDFNLRSRSALTMARKRFSKTCLRKRTVHKEMRMGLPSIMAMNTATCWPVDSWLTLTGFIPVDVRADMLR